MKKRKTSRPAFTLAETLIGLTVVVVAITATTALVVSGIRGNALNRERLIAYHLAAEGLEAMRNIRDSNWLQNQGWRSAHPAQRGVSWARDGRYIVDRNMDYVITGDGTPFILTPFDASADRSCLAKVVVQGSTRYEPAQCSHGEKTQFKRLIRIETPHDPIRATTHAAITSDVTWIERGQTHVVSLSTRLTDWKPSPL